jgi:hypothetical protein
MKNQNARERRIIASLEPLATKKHIDPRAEKLRDSKKIRNKFHVYSMDSFVQVINDQLFVLDGLDESGFPFWETTSRWTGNYVCRHYRRDKDTPKDTGNGRLEIRGWRGLIHGKSSRVGMRERQQIEREVVEHFAPEEREYPDWDEQESRWVVDGDWRDYTTPEKQAEMDSFNRLVEHWEDIWQSMAHWDDEEREYAVTINEWIYSREFDEEVMMLRGSKVINKRGNVVAQYPVKGEAREQAWVESLERAS